MRRILSIAALVLVAGAAINVAVTWACAMWGPDDFPVTGDRGNTGGVSWHLEHGSSRVATVFVLEWDRPWHLYEDKPLPDAVFPKWAQSVAAGPIPPVAIGRTEGRYAVAAGWPLRSMRYDADTVAVGSNVTYAVREGLVVAATPGGLPFGGILPLRPIFGGFAANTLLYAVAALTIGVALLAARSRNRLARGRCPTCAYPVGQTARCTECGRPITTRQGAARRLRAPRQP